MATSAATFSMGVDDKMEMTLDDIIKTSRKPKGSKRDNSRSNGQSLGSKATPKQTPKPPRVDLRRNLRQARQAAPSVAARKRVLVATVTQQSRDLRQRKTNTLRGIVTTISNPQRKRTNLRGTVRSRVAPLQQLIVSRTTNTRVPVSRARKVVQRAQQRVIQQKSPARPAGRRSSAPVDLRAKLNGIPAASRPSTRPNLRISVKTQRTPQRAPAAVRSQVVGQARRAQIFQKNRNVMIQQESSQLQSQARQARQVTRSIITNRSINTNRNTAQMVNRQQTAGSRTSIQRGPVVQTAASQRRVATNQVVAIVRRGRGFQDTNFRSGVF
mmetsp:Transcript_11311/g.19137  ORF Transcript_11311/g.19137 Transcript_11311/m.19137 type:complete len:327 (+) Transcript_11311:201-1181(+)